MKLINLFFFLVTINFFGQIQVQDAPANGNINTENPFLDASAYDLSIDSSSAGKGLVFPRTDLTTFAFNIANLYSGSSYFQTGFDGMIVYNSVSGNTLASVGDNNGLVTTVTPGFYYFSNPYGADNRNVTSGVWTPLGSTSVKNVTSTPTATATAINGAQVWVLSGSFIIPPANTTAEVSIPKPAGITGYYKMTTYIGGKTFRSDISSLTINIDPLALNVLVVTGSGLFSEVYPAGTYTYTLEYFKS